MSGHTPAPWIVNGTYAQVDVPGRDAPICRLLWPTEIRSEDETRANGFLIAAAPELLTACQDARRLLAFAGCPVDWLDGVITRATAGIA